MNADKKKSVYKSVMCYIDFEKKNEMQAILISEADDNVPVYGVFSKCLPFINKINNIDQKLLFFSPLPSFNL